MTDLRMRLWPSDIGKPYRVTTVAGETITGTLRAYNSDWVNLDDGTPSGRLVRDVVSIERVA